MHRFRHPCMLFFIALLTCLSPTLVLAGGISAHQEGLQPLTGLIVETLEDQVLIDLSSSDGLQKGDLLRVDRPGKNITHPVSGEVLGTIEESRTVLKVTRVKSGYSYTRVISGSGEIARGEKVTRFSGLSAALYSPHKSAADLYTQLKNELPDLDWQGHFNTDQAADGKSVDLRFILSGTRLTLLDAEDDPLRSLEIATALPQVTAPSPPTSITPAPSVPASLPPQTSASAITWDSGSGRQGSLNPDGQLQGRALMAAFIRIDGRLLVATVDESQLRIFDLQDDGPRLITSALIDEIAATPLTISWWQPTGESNPYLAISASSIAKRYLNTKETELSGAIYRYADKKLTPVATRISYFMTTYDRDGDQYPETLMGQEFDLDVTFGRIFELRLNGSKVNRHKPDFTLPPRYALPGSTMGDLDGDGSNELVTVGKNALRIYNSAGELVFESTEDFGGSLATLTYDLNPGMLDSLSDVVSFEIQPQFSDIDADGGRELLLVSADRSFIKIPGIGADIKKSWISILKYRDGIYDMGRMKFERQEAIQGLWAEADRIYLVTSKGADKQSTLLSYDLPDHTP